jgi:hypothetical protein
MLSHEKRIVCGVELDLPADRAAWCVDGWQFAVKTTTWLCSTADFNSQLTTEAQRARTATM